MYEKNSKEISTFISKWSIDKKYNNQIIGELDYVEILKSEEKHKQDTEEYERYLVKLREWEI